MSEDFEKLDQEQAIQQLKEIKREIRKHEFVFLIFVAIAVTTIILIVLGKIPFETMSILTLAICIASCYGIFKYSEPYETKKQLVELIIAFCDKDDKKNKDKDE